MRNDLKTVQDTRCMRVSIDP